MALPLFSPQLDPGPDFTSLLEARGIPVSNGSPSNLTPHGTTVLAIRYSDGVIMAGDRRATAGHSIEHRAMEKVFPADHYSAVAISGAAGMAIEMVKLFQVQLEHYEKVEGSILSLDGKANQLAQMVATHLPMAMQGFTVVPLYCGYDVTKGRGRIFSYDAAGGHYEEEDFQTTGSGGRDARNTIKLGYHEDLSFEDGIDLAVMALYEAADADTATGGPDFVRGIYPVVATVSDRGYARVDDSVIAQRFEGIVQRRQGTVGRAGGSLR